MAAHVIFNLQAHFISLDSGLQMVLMNGSTASDLRERVMQIARESLDLEEKRRLIKDIKFQIKKVQLLEWIRSLSSLDEITQLFRDMDKFPDLMEYIEEHPEEKRIIMTSLERLSGE